MIPWWEFALAIPLSAVVLSIGGDVVKSMLKSREKQLELRLKAQQEQNKKGTKLDGDMQQQLDAIRAEIATLRDTTTQFDITVDHTMQRMEDRLSRLETKAAAQPAMPSPEEVTQQRLGRR